MLFEIDPPLSILEQKCGNLSLRRKIPHNSIIAKFGSFCISQDFSDQFVVHDCSWEDESLWTLKKEPKTIHFHAGKLVFDSVYLMDFTRNFSKNFTACVLSAKGAKEVILTAKQVTAGKVRTMSIMNGFTVAAFF